jgi:hypothetical protein
LDDEGELRKEGRRKEGRGWRVEEGGERGKFGSFLKLKMVSKI